MSNELMRVAFRVEGEPNIGLGHIMRCLALAQRLMACGHEVCFFMSVASQQFCCRRADWCGEILSITDRGKERESEWLVNQCIKLQMDWLVLDGYQFEQSYRRALQSAEFKLAVFDDTNTSGALYADLIINGAPNAALLNYQLTAPKALLAVGPNHQVLRQEFLKVANNNWSNRTHLTLMFGGSDPKNLTIRVLQSLQKYKPAMPITIITGAAYAQWQDLSELVNNSGLDIKYVHDCQNMAEVLLSTKLALSAAGGSQFELLACATPSLLVVVADNQKNATQDAVNQGWCQAVNVDSLFADELVTQCLSLWQQPDLLQVMHQKALLTPAIDGAQNIVNLMTEQQMKSDKLL